MTALSITSAQSTDRQGEQTALLVGLVTLLISGALCLIALHNADYNPLSFAKIGTQFAERDPEGTRGYDGQFAYYIARDGADAVPYVDGPTLHYQRVLYPVAARLLALGNPEVVPWTLILINLLAHSISAALVAYLLNTYRVSPWFALIYSLWLGELFAVRLDLNEPLFMVLALGAVVAYQHQRYRWTMFLLILSTLSKELGLVIAAGLALHAWFDSQRGTAIRIFLAPLLAFLAWWGVMRVWLGTLPTIYPAAKVHFIPLQGMLTEDNPLELLFLAIWLGIPAVVLLFLALRTICRKRAIPLGAALMVVAAGWVLVMPDVSWQDPIAAYRVALPLVVCTLLFIAQSYPRRLPWLAALWLPSLLVVLMTPTLWFGGA
jgi:hypothetical protein